jgi:hypothetical protein
MNPSPPPADWNDGQGSFDNSNSVLIVLEGNENATVRPLRPELRRLREQQSIPRPPAPPANPLKPKEGQG